MTLPIVLEMEKERRMKRIKNTKYILPLRQKYVKPRMVKEQEFIESFDFVSVKKQNAYQKKKFKKIVYKTFIDMMLKDLIINEVEYNITSGKLNDVFLKIGTIEKFLGYYNFQEHLKNGNKDSKRYAVRIGMTKQQYLNIYKQAKTISYYNGTYSSKSVNYSIPYKGMLTRTYHRLLKQHVKETGIIYKNKFIAINE